MEVVGGSYVGDGTDDRSISGVGFQPELVLIQGENSNRWRFRTASMTGDVALRFNSVAGEANHIQAFEADGFQVGTAFNASGVAHHWLAVRDAGDGDFAHGTYTGDATDDRSISGLGFEPAVVVCGALQPQRRSFRTTAHPDGFSSWSGRAIQANHIQAFEADGFQVGSDTTINGSGLTFYWIAFAASNGVGGGTYTGDGADDRDIAHGLGAAPKYLLTKASASLVGCGRHATYSGDLSSVDGSTAAADRIQGLESLTFQVGTHANVNGPGTRYDWWSVTAPTLPTISGSASLSLAPLAFAAAAAVQVSGALAVSLAPLAFSATARRYWLQTTPSGSVSASSVPSGTVTGVAPSGDVRLG